MATNDYRRAADLARSENEALVGELRGLMPDDWGRPTCCAGWDVKTEVAHLAFATDFLASNVEQGLMGNTQLSLTPEARQRWLTELSGLQAGELIDRLAEKGERFYSLLMSLSPEQAETPAWHPNGLRPASWFALQWLQEAACHRWDLLQATGTDAELPAACAEMLLPMIAASNMPAAYRRFGPKGVNASYVLGVAGDPSRQWTLRAADGQATAEEGTGEAQARILGQPSWLLLALWGRIPIAQLRAAGKLAVEGDVAAGDRFKEIFKGP